MRKLLALALALSLHLAAAADQPPITLGGLFNITGRQAALDLPASQGAQLAVEQANQNNAPLQRQVRLVLMDGASDPAGLVNRTREMLATHPRLCALLGFSETDFVLAAAPMGARQRLPFVTSGATSPRLTREVPNYLFLAAFGDNVQAAAAAEFACADLQAKTAYIIYDDSTEYTRLLQQYFVTRFQEMGGQVLGLYAFNPQQVDRLSLKAAKADVLFVAAGPQEALPAVRRLRSMGLDMPILGGDAFDSNVWSGAGDVSKVYYTTHAYLGESNTRPAVVNFRQAYAARFPGSTPDAFAALGYDTVNLLLTAIRQSNSAESDKIRDGLAQMNGFEGVTGTISYPNGNPIPSKSVSLVKLEKGQSSLVRELTPRSVPEP